MGYSNTTAQMQTTETGNTFSGANAQRKMVAVPVLQKVEAEEELPIQGVFVAQRQAPEQDSPIQTKPNNTGMPDNLKSGVENLSGFSMDDVKVHYNSSKPAQLQALAYAQGTDIHVAPRQEQHLPHEAWHVVQQKQGRVQPTMQMKEGLAVNDDKGLESEADVMGGKAMLMKVEGNTSESFANYLTQKKSSDKQGFEFVNNRPRWQKLPLEENSKTTQLKINYNTICKGLNGGNIMPNPETVCWALKNRWKHLDNQIIIDNIKRIDAQRAIWTVSQIYDGFRAMVTANFPVLTCFNGRPPTLFTHTHTKVGNQISRRGIPQGPHTLAYGAILEALFVGHDGRLTLDLFNAQIQTPQNWWENVIAELSQSQLDDEDLQQRLSRARNVYNAYYYEALAIFDSKMDMPQRLRILMEHLMQLDPYATYAWANKKSNPDVSGHGENTNINDDRNIDNGGNFNSPDGLSVYIAKRRTLV